MQAPCNLSKYRPSEFPHHWARKKGCRFGSPSDATSTKHQALERAADDG